MVEHERPRELRFCLITTSTKEYCAGYSDEVEFSNHQRHKTSRETEIYSPDFITFASFL